MKRNIPYIVLAAIIIGIIVAVKPWKNGRTSLEEGADTTAVQSRYYLPAEENASNQNVQVKTCIYMDNSGSMDGYVNLNSEFKDALGKIIVKSNNYSITTDLFFVNDAIYDVQQTALKGDVNNFVSQLNASNMKVGATGSSNINKIFKIDSHIDYNVFLATTKKKSFKLRMVKIIAINCKLGIRMKLFK